MNKTKLICSIYHRPLRTATYREKGATIRVDDPRLTKAATILRQFADGVVGGRCRVAAGDIQRTTAAG
jgi:hypothetical protein